MYYYTHCLHWRLDFVFTSQENYDMSMIKVAKPNNDDDSSGSDGQQKKKSESTSSSFRSNDETEPDDTGSTNCLPISAPT